MIQDILVELRSSRDEYLGEARIRSPYRLPTGDVSVVSHSRGRLVLRLRPRSGAFAVDERGEEVADAPVGAIPILSARPDGEGLEVVPLTLQPPAPFTAGDIDTMWRSTASLPAEVTKSVRRDGVSAARARRGGPGLYTDPVPELATLARHAASRWPLREAAEVGWRPADVPGGREDVAGTVARLGVAGARARPGGGFAPERTLRRRTSTDPWALAGVSDVMRAVVRRLQEPDVAAEDFTRALAPVAAVAQLSKAPPAQSDPPPSSWPPVARRLYELGISVLAGVSAAGIGADRAPLAHLWALYESWVASSTLETLRALLGEPQAIAFDGMNSQRRAAWHATWTTTTGEVTLYSQTEIGISAPNMGMPIVSITAGLIPDTVLVVREGNATRVVAIDAKLRGITTLTSGELSREASHYLWSVRRSDDLARHGLDHVVLITSGPGSVPAVPDTAAMSAVTATPGQTTALQQQVAAVVSP